MPRWHELERAGTTLACADFGGQGSGVMLLHGLCGHAEEWGETASWLAATHRVVAPDARGHGRSERRPSEVSRAAHVGDAAAWLEHLGLGPAAVVGKSLVGHTAFLLAARRPDLVRAVAVVEATPDADADAHGDVLRWLERWPVPFANRAAALEFFGGDAVWSGAWADGLAAGDDGLRPRFDVDVMIASLTEIAATSYWDEWRMLRCPILLVRGERGVARETMLRMLERHPNGTLVEIRDAAHDVHLEQSAQWRRALESFLGRL